MSTPAEIQTLIQESRCIFSCYSPPTQQAMETYVMAYVAGSGSDPNNLIQSAKCWTCFDVNTLLLAKAYLLLDLAGAWNGWRDALNGTACYECIPPGMNQSIDTYFALNDPNGPTTDAAELARLSRCLNCLDARSLLEVQVDQLAKLDEKTVAEVIDAVTDPTTGGGDDGGGGGGGVVPPGIERRVVTRGWVVNGGGGGLRGCTDVPSDLIPVITVHYTAGIATSLDILFPKVCCNAGGYWIYGIAAGAPLQQGIIDASHNAEENYQILGVDITGIADATGFYVRQYCEDLSESGDSNSVSQYDGEIVASAWADRVEANGGVRPSVPTITAVGNFWNSVVAAGLNSKMLCVNIFAPDNDIACLTPLIKIAGTDPWTIQGAGTHVLTIDGWRFSVPSSSCFKTGINCLTAFSNDTSAGCSIYVSAKAASFGGTASRWSYGYWNLTGALPAFFGRFDNGDVFNWTQSISCGSARANPGYLSGNRVASNDLRQYFANSGTAHAQIGVVTTNNTVSRTADPFYLGGTWRNDTNPNPFGPSEERYSFFALHLGLTITESATFFNLIQAYRTALGGGFV